MTLAEPFPGDRSGRECQIVLELGFQPDRARGGRELEENRSSFAGPGGEPPVLARGHPVAGGIEHDDVDRTDQRGHRSRPCARIGTRDHHDPFDGHPYVTSSGQTDAGDIDGGDPSTRCGDTGE